MYPSEIFRLCLIIKIFIAARLKSNEMFLNGIFDSGFF